MKKKRYVNDGKIFFYQVVLVLHDGTVIKEIFDSPINNVDHAWYNYPEQVIEKYKGKVESYGLNQISKHDPRAKQYMKLNNISIPSSEPEIVKFRYPQPVIDPTPYIEPKPSHGGPKYAMNYTPPEPWGPQAVKNREEEKKG